MEITKIEFIILVTLLTAFCFNALIRWKVLDHYETNIGSKWYLPKWLPGPCEYCTTVWLSVFVGVPIILYFSLSWEFYIFAIASSQGAWLMVRN